MRVVFSEIAVSNSAQSMRAIVYVMLHVVLNVTVLTTLELYRTLHMFSSFRTRTRIDLRSSGMLRNVEWQFIT